MYYLKGTDTLSREKTLSELLPPVKGSTVKANDLLPMVALSFLSSRSVLEGA